MLRRLNKARVSGFTGTVRVPGFAGNLRYCSTRDALNEAIADARAYAEKKAKAEAEEEANKPEVRIVAFLQRKGIVTRKLFLKGIQNWFETFFSVLWYMVDILNIITAFVLAFSLFCIPFCTLFWLITTYVYN